MKYFQSVKKVILMAGFPLPFSYCTAQVPAYVPTDHLEGWWPFTGNANDQSIHSRNGTVNGALLTTDRMGNVNAAYRFNGTSDYIAVPPTGISNAVRTTVAAWVKYTGDAQSDRFYDTYFQMGNHPGNTLGYAYEYTTGQLNIYTICKGSSNIPAAIANDWHHIVIVEDSLNTLVYQDGDLLSTFISSTPTCYGGTNQLVFGASPTDLQWMTGSLDDIGFWTRALSACEISDLYHAALSTSGIITQPTNQNGSIGGSVSFTIAASASTFQWQTNTGAGGTFINIVNGGQYSGATTNTLTLSALTAANNNQLFRCVVSGKEGTCSATSTVVTLSVNTTGIGSHPYLAGSSLGQNYPNPATEVTTIPYYIRTFKNNAAVQVCDIAGRKISTTAITQPGNGHLELNTTQLGKGIYFYNLVIDGIQVAQKKMVIFNN